MENQSPSPEVAAAQLYAAAKNLSQRLDAFLGSNEDGIATLLLVTADTFVQTLADAEVTEVTRATALRALAVMRPVTDAAFWRSALGRMISWHVGYGAAEVPRVHAAAILGVTRQRVAQMVNSGDLAVEGAGVANQSLLNRLWAAGLRG